MPTMLHTLLGRVGPGDNLHVHWARVAKSLYDVLGSLGISVQVTMLIPVPLGFLTLWPPHIPKKSGKCYSELR